jgi:hypothetical protein
MVGVILLDTVCHCFFDFSTGLWNCADSVVFFAFHFIGVFLTIKMSVFEQTNFD